MGPLVLLHVALVGFFLCAALYSALAWSGARENRTLLIFSLQCLLCAGLSVAFVRLATTHTIAGASSALVGRLICGLLDIAVTAFLISRLTGLRARGYCWFVLVFSVVASLAALILGAPQPVSFSLGSVVMPWGETISVLTWSSLPWTIIASYAVVVSVEVFGIIGGLYLARRDRLGGVLIGLAASTGLVAAIVGFTTHGGRIAIPYLGNVPFAFWVILAAVQLSRENLRIRHLQTEGDRRLRAIFDHTLHSMGLLDVRGVVLEANRPVLESIGVVPAAVLGQPFWQTPLWAHSEELRERLRLAVGAAAGGETVSFETWQPLPDGSTGCVEFSLKPIVGHQGQVTMIVAEGRDVTASKRTQEALDRLAEVIAPRTGQDFFQTLVNTLCEICEVDMAIVASADPQDPRLLRTIAIADEGRPAENFQYERLGTPCEMVIGGELRYYPTNVQALFPADTMLATAGLDSYMGIPIESRDGGSPGLVALLHHAPMRDPAKARALLHVVSARAGAELERRRTDAALHESENRFRRLIEDLEVGVVMQDVAGHVIVANQAAARMVGLSEDQRIHFAGRIADWPLYAEDGTPYRFDQLPSVVATRTGQPVRNAIVGAENRQTGTRSWFQVTATPQPTHDGSVQHVLVTFVDVTDRKRAEDTVRSSSRRLALAISATSDAVWEWHCQTGETYYSPRWFEMLGLPSDLPMTIDTWKALCHPDDLAPTLDGIAAMTAQRDGHGYEAEFRMRRGDGTWAWVLGRGNAVEWDADGRPLLMAGTNTDISQRKEAEVRRRELEVRLAQTHRMESMGRLAGGIAHDFNNILTVINGYSDLLIHTATLDSSATEMLTDIRDAGDRAAALTRQLLTFSRHQVVDPAVVELNMVVADTERMLQRLIGEHIRLTTRLSAEALWVRGDPGQLGQILVNLVVNARDAMPDGGTLAVSTSLAWFDALAAGAVAPEARPGTYAVLSVSDTGTGIPTELQELVFEPFFTTKGPGKGTGLGLTTVHGMVRQADGFLTVHSQPGVGSTFTIYLPVAPEPEPQARNDSGDSNEVPSRKTVLMVEDEVAVRNVVQVMLRRMGFEVLTAGNADEALDLERAFIGSIDLLVTDVIMPGMNGRRLTEQLLTLRPGLRVLYMSGYTDDEVVQQVVLNADATYIQKPFDADALARKVRQAFETAPPDSTA